MKPKRQKRVEAIARLEGSLLDNRDTLEQACFDGEDDETTSYFEEKIARLMEIIENTKNNL